jgi:hypothetical protein
MRHAVFKGATGRHQCLAKHLATEHIGKAKIFTLTLKVVVSDGDKVQQFHQFAGYVEHYFSC